jgi:uncharacterized protein (UPF0548 family)
VPLDAATVLQLRAQTATYDAGSRPGAADRRDRGLRERRGVGTGEAAFLAASDALMSWRVHEGAGFGVRASDAAAVVGTVVVLTTRFGPLAVVAPCRVVRVIEEERRRGFAYVTLPGHPVAGEEEFIVERCGSGDVTATISALSHPATRLARLGAPVTRREQRRIATRYLDALAVAASPT